MQRLDLAAIAATPWKNGGGATRELACWPPGADLEHFGWRVSVADVAAPGPFSLYPGVDRQILLWQGEGMHLRSADGSVDRVLGRATVPFAFAGEVAIDCTLQGGPVRDLNLMLRRGQWRGALRVLHDACTPGESHAGLCLVLAGRWERAGEAYAPGQGLWWSAPRPGAPLRSVPGGLETPALAWIALDRKFE